MRALVLIALAAVVVCVAGVEIGRPNPTKLHNKLAHRRSRLGEGQAVGSATKAEIEALEHLRVAAAERSESLADRFAIDLEAHVAEAVTVESGDAVEAELASEDEAQVAVAEEATEEAVAETETEAEAETGLSIETLQELEFTKSSVFAPRKALLKSGAKPATLKTDGIRWSNCQVAGKAKSKKAKAAPAQSKLSNVVLRAAPPMRDQSFIVEIDGTYAGPDVTYGSVTLQIARVSSAEPQAKDIPQLVYRHSVVLKDVLMANPFTAKDPLSATMFVPESAFNMYAPSGQYSLSVVFTNQDKQPFACTKIDFALA
jgi:hypothetical protein